MLTPRNTATVAAVAALNLPAPVYGERPTTMRWSIYGTRLCIRLTVRRYLPAIPGIASDRTLYRLNFRRVGKGWMFDPAMSKVESEGPEVGTTGHGPLCVRPLTQADIGHAPRLRRIFEALRVSPATLEALP